MIENMDEPKTLIILWVITIILSLLLTVIVIIIKDFKLDYECSKLPYEVFIKEIKCEKYWRYRNG